jgi:hypothetical protein
MEIAFPMSPSDTATTFANLDKSIALRWLTVDLKVCKSAADRSDRCKTRPVLL